MEVVAVGKSKKALQHFPLHRHGYWEILLNLTGHGEMILDDKRCPFSPGDICIIPPEVPHEKHARESFTDISMIIKEMRPIGEREAKFISDDAGHMIQTLMETAYHIYEGAPNIPPERTYVILNALGEAVYQTLAGLFSSNRQKNRSIDGFIERMEANISNPDFHLTREIEKYGYNVVYFRKLFKHTIGESPLSYFNRIRIEYAQKEFHHYGPSRSVKDIASASGFTDPYYFSRIFKKITGVSPKSYVSNLGSFDPEIIHKEEPQ